ncbi:MAG: hypothetical protein IPO83_18210 [Chitinophagaceae bacterium]|nr:hypothetical protein [Chitinophagaceae bacterium]
MIENSLSNIFTEPDGSIFSDGSIDPMGLRIIWTSMGNRIFGNRLNTISTDIRFFTLNLFNIPLLPPAKKNLQNKLRLLLAQLPITTLPIYKTG